MVQAVLDAPLFEVRWRWAASIALAVRRNRNGKRVPPQLQRMDAEDLVALVFPDQIACLENIQGNREVPDHPLIDQSLADCLHEAMDVEGLEDLICRIDDGAVDVLGTRSHVALADGAGSACGTPVRLLGRRSCRRGAARSPCRAGA